MSLLARKVEKFSHRPNLSHIHSIHRSDDLWTRVSINYAFGSIHARTPYTKRTNVKSTDFTRSVAKSIGLKKLPPANASALLRLEGMLSGLFENDNRSSDEIVLEAREVD
jgi:hypothetical protein